LIIKGGFPAEESGYDSDATRKSSPRSSLKNDFVTDSNSNKIITSSSDDCDSRYLKVIFLLVTQFQIRISYSSSSREGTAKDIDSISSASDNSGTHVKKHIQEEQLKQSETHTPKMIEKKENKSNTNTIKVRKWHKNERLDRKTIFIK